MISDMVTSRALMPAPTTRNAKSLAVNIPAIRSSSSVTRTQSSLLAAMSCAASATVVFGLIWRAWLGFRARTVPGGALRVCRARGAFPFFLLRSASIFFLMACSSLLALGSDLASGHIERPHPASTAFGGLRSALRFHSRCAWWSFETPVSDGGCSRGYFQTQALDFSLAHDLGCL